MSKWPRFGSCKTRLSKNIGKRNALSNLKSKIKLLEYRGYDSSGISVYDPENNNFYIKKTIGTIDRIKDIK